MLKIKFRNLTYFFSILLSTTLAGCSTVAPNYKTVGNLNNLSQLQDLHAEVLPAKKADMNKLHAQAIQDVAMSVGAQAGLAWRL